MKTIITIGRQFGSGGHEIGQMLADRLEIPLYDHRLVSMAAEALNLDFIEIGVEDYDFAIRTQDLKLPQVKAFLQILRSSEFHEKLKEIGGYAAPHAGEIKHLFLGSNEALF